ncbi:MAG TPA: SGNH/GDSL hydrolase family protein [Methylovirgula sp.]|nr:SGNH/GDSL hydrolase family protein [Methylovirgula sp.]
MLRNVRRLYAAAAIMLLNFILLFLVVNLGLAWISPAPYGSAAPEPPGLWLAQKYGFARLSHAYPGWKLGDLREFFTETNIGTVSAFEPFTQFRPIAGHSRFINISPDGFRIGRAQAPWPPLPSGINIFFFGGSTTLGVGVPDDRTIASDFQSLARQCNPAVSVYNFGRAFYFSTQERILFQQLLLQGHVPAIAIFLDGLNDFHFDDGQPEWTDRLQNFMAGRPDVGLLFRQLAPRVPIGRWIGNMLAEGQRHALLAPGGSDETIIPDTSTRASYEAPAPITLEPDANDVSRAQAVVQRLLRNEGMTENLGKTFGVKVLNVLQPVPTFGYDLRYLNIFSGDIGQFAPFRLTAAGYKILEQAGPTGRGEALWLGDMQRARMQNLYVDDVHYTEAFSREIAERIFKETIARNLFACRG